MFNYLTVLIQLDVFLCLQCISCELASVNCGVAIASLSKCLICDSKYLEYSRVDTMHMAVVLSTLGYIYIYIYMYMPWYKFFSYYPVTDLTT